jgi:import inner membrane translocase subunit TIM21
VQSQIVRNSLTGHEHLILRFWIHGRGLNESEEVGVLGWCRGRWKDLKGWTSIAARRIGMIGPDESQAKTTMAVHQDQSSVHPSAKEHAPSTSRSSGSWWGMFSSLRPSAAKGHEHAAVKMGRKELPPAGTYKQGEARADYVKVSTQYPAFHSHRMPL